MSCPQSTSLTLSPPTLPHAHYSPSTLPFLLFLNNARLNFISDPCACSYYSGLYSNVTSLEMNSLNILLKLLLSLLSSATSNPLICFTVCRTNLHLKIFVYMFTCLLILPTCSHEIISYLLCSSLYLQ